MRKYGRWLTILLATLAFFAGVSHIKAESLPAGSQTEEKEMTAAAASSASGKILVIDEKHIYPGMTGAYQNGYTPAIEKGKARLVLPLICAGTAEPDAKGDYSIACFLWRIRKSLPGHQLPEEAEGRDCACERRGL